MRDAYRLFQIVDMAAWSIPGAQPYRDLELAPRPLRSANFAVSAGGAALAHHSFAMFASESPIEIAGTVVEFKYTSPHSFILVDVKGKDGANAVWNLEGPSPSILARDGMSSKTLKPGDELVLTIDPLRSGAPGGSWSLAKTKFKDGKSIGAQ